MYTAVTRMVTGCSIGFYSVLSGRLSANVVTLKQYRLIHGRLMVDRDNPYVSAMMYIT